MIRFDAPLETIQGHTIVRLPAAASKKLPSRGQVAVAGRINGHAFETVVEPDGTFGHWIKIDAKLRKVARSKNVIELDPVDEWPEPKVPSDLKKALTAAPSSIRELWKTITPMARWEWVRWINETRNPQTRLRRVEVSISKLSGGKRRPCCFNLASCTDPELAKSGKLIDPSP